MATVENLPSPQTERPIGFGRLKRKEDARFIRGQGTYLDDIKLPGMVHGALLRSPYAHAKIKKIDSPVAGRANVLMVPDLEAGNMLAKSLSFLAGADAAGIVLGARVPIILTSRADNVRSRIASCAVAVLAAHARRRASAAA